MKLIDTLSYIFIHAERKWLI